MKKLIRALCITSLFLLGGCGGSDQGTMTTHQPSTLPHQPKLQPTLDLLHLRRSYPRVDGSTSTLPLQVAIACKIYQVECAWREGNFFDPTRHLGPAAEIDRLQKEAERITRLNHSGTHGAYVNLIQGETDLILVARAPSEDELKQAKQAGVQLEVHPVALDAFVFLVNTENPVDSLSLEDIRAIYTGRLPDWSGVGGTEGTIHTYRRNRNSGSQELMERLVMVGDQMIESPDMLLETMMGPINAISMDPEGIGYSVYFYAEFIYPHELVKLIGVESVHPTAKTIADRTYPLTTEVYAVVRKGIDPKSPEGLLLAWLLTPEGQATVRDSGYVPLSP